MTRRYAYLSNMINKGLNYSWFNNFITQQISRLYYI